MLAIVIKAYQKWAPKWVKGNCPNVPHCSQYGLEAVQEHGSIPGGLMAYRRMMSCGAVALAAMAAMDGGVTGNPMKDDCCPGIHLRTGAQMGSLLDDCCDPWVRLGIRHR